MKRKTLLLFSCVCLLISCLHEESFHQRKSEGWFGYTDTRMRPIVSTMQALEFEHPFMDEFCCTYGVPLWDKTDVSIDSGKGTVYFWVPLYKEGAGKKIQTVWFFEMKDNKLSYSPISRNAEMIKKYGQDAQFDVLTYQVFGDENSSVTYKSSSANGSYQTVGYNCVDAYVTLMDEYGNKYSSYKGTTCKEIKVWIDYMDMTIVDDDRGGGGGPVGGSGSNVPVRGDAIADLAPRQAAYWSIRPCRSTIGRRWKK